MGPKTQGVPVFVWEAPGKPVVVLLHLDVVDRILAEIMRGFGAIPKRGAEIGGVLLGTIEHGDPSIVRVEDFECVECSYKRGPSYLFTRDEMGAFEEACHRWRPDPSRPAYPVGFFRSQTRDGFSLSLEDIELLDRHFPSPAQIALLVKPYGTKVSMGGFFFREDGAFQATTPLEFPFRRRDLTGEDPPPRRPMIEGHPLEQDMRTMVPTAAAEAPERPDPAYVVTPPAKSPLRGAIWIPLSFVLLLLGIALGIMIAWTRGGKAPGGETFSLGLSVYQVDANLGVKWDRLAPAIRAAQRGSLEIEDSGYTKVVDLDTATLQNGVITVQNPSHTVRFRLTVFPGVRVGVTETLEWKQ